VAEEAKEANKKIVLGRRATLEKDIQEFDAYGRTLGYLWVEDTLVNAELLNQGYARLMTVPPNVKYLDTLKKAAENGGNARVKFWQSVTSQTADCTADKPIKGNININGEKIYHEPGGDYYLVTNPEECFSTDQEALAAGYRESRK